VKTTRIRELTLFKNPGPSGSKFYDGLTSHLSKRIHGYDFLKGALKCICWLFIYFGSDQCTEDEI